jgi:hypothetical protein
MIAANSAATQSESASATHHAVALMSFTLVSVGRY